MTFIHYKTQGIPMNTLFKAAIFTLLLTPNMNAGPLHEAVKDDDQYMVEQLLDQGHNVNEFDEYGKTPYDYAINIQNIGILALLYRKQAKPSDEIRLLKRARYLV